MRCSVILPVACEKCCSSTNSAERRQFQRQGAAAREPLFANLHDDPRWLPFLRKIGKAPEQLAAINFDVTVPN